jgi:hypothetical protein
MTPVRGSTSWGAAEALTGFNVSLIDPPFQAAARWLGVRETSRSRPANGFADAAGISSALDVSFLPLR